jgi:hypothetical protein
MMALNKWKAAGIAAICVGCLAYTVAGLFTTRARPAPKTAAEVAVEKFKALTPEQLRLVECRYALKCIRPQADLILARLLIEVDATATRPGVGARPEVAGFRDFLQRLDRGEPCVRPSMCYPSATYFVFRKWYRLLSPPCRRDYALRCAEQVKEIGDSERTCLQLFVDEYEPDPSFVEFDREFPPP